MTMSRNAWRDAVRTSTLPPAQRAVANALAAYWPTGTTFPVLWASVATLAADTGYSERHVKRSMAALETGGWLTLVRPARQHHAPRYAPAVPREKADPGPSVPAGNPDEPGSQGGHDVPSGPVDNDAQGGQEVTSAESPGVTSTPPRGDRVSPDPEDPEGKNPPTPRPSTGRRSAPRVEERGGWPSHIHEPNTVQALAARIRNGRLPLDVDELLAAAYAHGNGDPWAGYLAIKEHLDRTLDGAVNASAVLRARLRRAS